MENEALKKAALAAGANPMSVAKVIQPTATVQSVPVSGPSNDKFQSKIFLCSRKFSIIF